MSNRTKWGPLGAPLLALPLGLVTAAAIAGSNSTMLPNGAALSVSVDDPVTGTEFKVPAGLPDIDVEVQGMASIGVGEPDATLIYVIDTSGSTVNGTGTECAPILQCEQQFFVALNNAAVSDGSTDLVAVVNFGTSAATPLGLTDPTDPSVNTTINGLTAAGYTNCGDALIQALALTNSPANTNGTTIVVLASDGHCLGPRGNQFPDVEPAANLLGATGAIVHSVAVGAGSDCTTEQPSGGTGRLDQIPQNGGECFEVDDPGDLPSIIQNLIGATLNELAIEVNGGGRPIDNADIDPSLPQDAALAVDYTTTAQSLVAADHEICVTATGSDSTGSMTDLTQCETIHLLQLTASPATDTSELGADNDHTVNAQILGGTAPVRNVDFRVVSGPNAGTVGSEQATPAGPQVEFTYGPGPNPGTDKLGTDRIEVSTIIAGVLDTVTLQKEWVDTTAPVPSCAETVTGRRFFQIGATDTVSSADEITIHVIDLGSGTEFGPFAVGDNIQYTQAPGAKPKKPKKPKEKDQAGDIAAHITGNGDMGVKATDFSGNMDTTTCLVR